LISQLQRCSSSVPSNIAEGSGRGSDADFERYLDIAFGSANELDYQLLLAHDLEHIPTEHYQQLYIQLVEVKQMLHRFIQKLTADG
jgi:four helix bundle protein